MASRDTTHSQASPPPCPTAFRCRSPVQSGRGGSRALPKVDLRYRLPNRRFCLKPDLVMLMVAGLFGSFPSVLIYCLACLPFFHVDDLSGPEPRQRSDACRSGRGD